MRVSFVLKGVTLQKLLSLKQSILQNNLPDNTNNNQSEDNFIEPNNVKDK